MLRDDAGEWRISFSACCITRGEPRSVDRHFVVLVLVDWRLLACGLLLLPAVYFSHRTWIHRIRPFIAIFEVSGNALTHHRPRRLVAFGVVRTFARQLAETRRFTLGNHLLVRQQLAVWWRTRLVEMVWESSSPSLQLVSCVRWLADFAIAVDLRRSAHVLGLFDDVVRTDRHAHRKCRPFQNNLAGLDRVLDLLAEPREMEDAPNALRVTKETSVGRMRVEGVGFQYPGNESWVLREYRSMWRQARRLLWWDEVVQGRQHCAT